jgi:hypothetical protein
VDPVPAPVLSTVLVTRAGAVPLADVWPTLAAQTIAHRIEVVVVGPARGLASDPPRSDGFASVRVVPLPAFRTVAHAVAEGVRRAAAPLVALVEDHVLLDPGWAEALVAAHAEGWAVVGPVVRIANPESRVAWADFVMGYGPFAEPREGGAVSFLPGHNSCYRRDVLLAQGERLEARLAAETIFHWDLARQGARLKLEPRARIAHLDFGRMGPWLATVFLSARVFAALRVAEWPLPRRIAFALASPLIPPVRFARSLRHARRMGAPASALPVLLLGLLVDGAAQGIGALAGAGNAIAGLADYELERSRFARRAPKRDAPSAAPAAAETK